MLRLAFGRPWRQTESVLGSILGLLGLDFAVPDHTTDWVRLDNNVFPPQHRAECCDRPEEDLRAGPCGDLRIDSTGLKVAGVG
jgi:hypothetical protein